MMKRWQICTLLAAVAIGATAGPRLAAQGASAALTVTSSAFKNGDPLPKDYSGDTFFPSPL